MVGIVLPVRASRGARELGGRLGRRLEAVGRLAHGLEQIMLRSQRVVQTRRGPDELPVDFLDLHRGQFGGRDGLGLGEHDGLGLGGSRSGLRLGGLDALGHGLRARLRRFEPFDCDRRPSRRPAA